MKPCTHPNIPPAPFDEKEAADMGANRISMVRSIASRLSALSNSQGVIYGAARNNGSGIAEALDIAENYPYPVSRS